MRLKDTSLYVCDGEITAKEAFDVLHRRMNRDEELQNRRFLTVSVVKRFLLETSSNEVKLKEVGLNKLAVMSAK